MPKLLRKNIYTTSMLSFLFCVVFAVINIIRLVNHSSIGAVYNGVNLFLWIITNPAMESKVFGFTLPDYIFIAPFSKEQRKTLVRKGLCYHVLAIGGWIMALVICPVMIYDIVHGDELQLLLCFTEAMILLSIVYSGAFLSYISKVDYGMSFFIGCIRFFQYVLFAGVAMSEIEKIDLILLLVDILFCIIVIFICRRKYYEPMLEYLADYEQSREKNKKREQKI